MSHELETKKRQLLAPLIPVAAPGGNTLFQWGPAVHNDGITVVNITTFELPAGKWMITVGEELINNSAFTSVNNIQFINPISGVYNALYFTRATFNIHPGYYAWGFYDNTVPVQFQVRYQRSQTGQAFSGGWILIEEL